MMFYAESLRVVLATVHIPLSEVPGALTRDAVESIDHSGRERIAAFRLRRARAWRSPG